MKEGSYVKRLTDDLDEIAHEYAALLQSSKIEHYEESVGYIVIGHIDHGWVKDDFAAEEIRFKLLQRLKEWHVRFRGLWGQISSHRAELIVDSYGLLVRWLERDGSDNSIPATIKEASNQVDTAVSVLKDLIAKTGTNEGWLVHLVVDTNALIYDPELNSYTSELGTKYMVHIPAIVFKELDELKSRLPAAAKANRKLKDLRMRSDPIKGVKVSGGVNAKFETLEPKSADVPSWLDLSIPDDRLIASTILLQIEHPRATFYVATADTNLQNKLAAAGILTLDVDVPSVTTE